MRIAIFGATGNIGRRITDEAVRRDHPVTAISRRPVGSHWADGRVSQARADVTDPAAVASAVRGHDAVISSVSPGTGQPRVLVEAARSLVEGLKRAGVRRLVVVGGAGSLEVTPGLQLVDTPEFPAAWKGVALAHRDALDVFRTAGTGDLDWTYFSPAAVIQPGTRTGRYRTGGDQLLTDSAGNSFITAEDFAVAVLDELERPAHVGQRLTVASQERDAA
jgi:putative NADH-flavin reductase